MIKVKMIGRMGNNLIAYAFARIVHEITKMKMGIEPTNEIFENHKFFPNAIFREGISKNPLVYMEDQKNSDNFLDRVLTQCKSSGVILSGFYQNCKYFLPYRQEMREWFDTPSIQLPIAHEDDFVAHIRHEDYRESGSIVTLNYYDQAIETYKKKNAKLYFVGKDLSKETIEYFEKKHNGIYFSKSGVEDFKFIQTFKNIIIANSSYSWLASFLSYANLIVAPLPSRGYWSLRSDQKLLSPELHKIIEDNNI